MIQQTSEEIEIDGLVSQDTWLVWPLTGRLGTTRWYTLRSDLSLLLHGGHLLHLAGGHGAGSVPGHHPGSPGTTHAGHPGAPHWSWRRPSHGGWGAGLGIEVHHEVLDGGSQGAATRSQTPGAHGLRKSSQVLARLHGDVFRVLRRNRRPVSFQVINQRY